MVVRRPVVLVSGALAELPFGDSIITTASGGTLTAGSGLVGGGNTDASIRLDVALTAEASGLIFAGDKLTVDGVALIRSQDALASGNAALTDSTTALASGNAALASAEVALSSGNAGLAEAQIALSSGNAALSLASTALSSGNASLQLGEYALASGNAALTDAATALASGNAALLLSETALASGNAALVDLSGKVDKAGDVISGTLVVDSQSYGIVSSTVSSGVILLDFSENNNFDVTLEGNSTLAPSVSPSGGQSGAVYIRQDGTGSRTLSYSGGFSFSNGSAPTLTTTASGVDLLAYYSPEPTTIVATLIAAVSGV